MIIRRIFYSVVRKWWLIILLAVLGGGLGYLSVLFIKPMYQADTKLYIKVSTTDRSLSPQDTTVNQQIVRQYSEIISSRLMTSAVLKDVDNFDITEKQLLSMIRIYSKQDSNILTITARGSDPTVVAAVANAAGREFTTHMRQLTNSDNVGILDEALVPNYQISNNKSQSIILGLVAGLMVAFGIICVIDYFDTTVRSAEDIEEGLKVRVIGIIPKHNIR